MLASSIEFLTSPRLIIGLVWSGMAALTVALVILMRTSWGHQQPLRKCVVLSLFAHLLFVAYATTIHIVRTHPHQGNGSAIRVTYLTDTDLVDAEGIPEARENENKATPFVDPVDPAPADDQLVERPAEEAHEPVAVDATSVVPVSEGPTIAAEESSTTEPPAADITEIAAMEPPSSPVDPPLPGALDGPETPGDELGKLISELAGVAGAAALLAQSDRLPTDETPSATDHSPPAENTEAGALVAVRPRSPAASTAVEKREAGRTTSNGPHTVPKMYRERMAPNRLQIAESFGGSATTEAAVKLALDWLARHQSADGRWDASDHGAGRESGTLGHDRQGAGAQADTGLTGLALLSFLGSGHTHQAGEYSKTVERGIDYLVASQAADGNLAGRAEIFAYMYCHGMATLALSEAYAMTGDPRLERPVRRAIAYTVAAQNSASGGWRYKPPYPRERGDTSQLGWQLMALKSAEQSGIAMPERTRQGIVRYLNSVSSGARGGLASYRPEERATHSMTAEALVCREFLDLQFPGGAEEAASYLESALPGQGPANFYYWYYGTLAMFQLQGPAWAKWNDAVSTVLTHSQRADADMAGSWDPDPVWGGNGGRVFSTALGTLCLEVYYRYLPLYTVTAGREKAAK